MKWILILNFLVPQGDSVTELLGDYVTESQCWDAAAVELDLRASPLWVGTGINSEPKKRKGAWIATCQKVWKLEDL